MELLQLYEYPETQKWSELCQRPVLDSDRLLASVNSIMSAVKQGGDAALMKFTKEFDGVELDELFVTALELCSGSVELTVPVELQQAIQLAANNIATFHKSQRPDSRKVTTMSGVTCWRKSLPIEKVGLYIPGGTAPLFSTLLMLGIPAKLAGCSEIVVCTPPQKDGNLAPEILYAAKLLNLTNIAKVGGAQAIAALTYGTESIPKVDKIFGPGNQYVTAAKQLAQQRGMAIDMPAGPSEVLIIADAECPPSFVAADLLSQAEHGPDSQVILVSDSKELIHKVQQELGKQLEQLSRKQIAQQALENSKAILIETLEEGISFSNNYAPEHLILALKEPHTLAESIQHAGSVFLGYYSCESAGDYASGTNHTLPTNGFARNYSGVSLDSFMKQVTFQELTREGIQNIGPAIEWMAEAEQLEAHKRAVSVRLKREDDV